ncbi:MAG: PD40 domain-containing protein [Planctomycetes bacterium]|nr:PD40 domain-containing protein [Planctomycetota bacterium]
MRERTRRVAIRIAWAALTAAVAMLVGLRVGRPLYYTDGQRPFAATELAASGMVRWSSPDVQCELPGPVVGRVAMLPDGRLLYGRGTADGTTDLVSFDPTRPTVPPEPAYGLDTEFNELAPAVGADGRIWFASDRPGAGGYDLWESRVTATGFAVPTPLAQCNTARDETDPAPHGNGVDFVFVRVDRAVDSRGGTLFQCRLGAAEDPTPVFANTAKLRNPPADRDPAFAPDGGALWFVRKEKAGPIRIVRASRLGGAFDEPRGIDEGWALADLRGPLPSSDGMQLFLLRPAKGTPGEANQPDLWYRATASELYPWWPGQRWLELLLLGAAFVSLLLLVLLHLGRRWTALDFLAQCLLLSLLLHVLLFLWLWGVEISGAIVPGTADDGALEVSVVDVATAAATSASAPGAGEEIAARVAFAPAERSLAPDAPPVAAERATDSPALAAKSAELDTNAARREIDVATRVNDAATPLAQRSGADAAVVTERAELGAVQASGTASAAAAVADMAVDAPTPVNAPQPTAAVERVAIAAPLVAGAPSGTSVPVADPAAAPVSDPGLRDAGAAAAVRSAADAARRGPEVVRTDVAPAPAAGDAAAKGEAATPAVAAAAAPAAGMTHERPAPLAAPRADGVLPVVAARDVTAPDTALRERPEHDAGAASRRGVDAEAPRIEAVANDAPRPRTEGAAGAAREAAAAERAVASDVALPVARLDATKRIAAAPPIVLPPSAGAAGPSERIAAPPVGALRDAPATGRSPAAPVANESRGVVPASPVAVATGPAAAAPAAARRSAGNSADVFEVTAPGGALERSTAAPPSTAIPTYQDVPVAGKGPRVAVQLREGPTMPAAGAAEVHAAAPSVATGAAPLPPVALPGVPGVTEATRAMTAAREAGTKPESLPAVEPPAVALDRVRNAVAVEPADFAARASAKSRTPIPTALRDGVASGRASERASPRGTGGGSPLAAAVVPRPERRSAAIEAPVRSVRPVLAPIPEERVEQPASLLERAVATPLAPLAGGPDGPSAYSNRFGPAKAKAIEKFGGTADTERAVAAGLRYLASIQSEDGTWGDRDHFDQKYGSVYVGKTALCVLAFLGAGHTPTSRTEHSAVVARAIGHLLALQDPDTGAFGPSSCYGHGITTYALAECYGITKDARMKRPVEEALSWILQNQGPRRDRRNRGGWGYFSPGLRPEDDYARVSVSSWMIMALESARLSGVDLPAEVLPRAREFLELSFDQQNGWFRYNHKPSRLNSAWPTLPASTPAGAFCLMLLGAAADDAKVSVAVEYTVERRPEAYRRYEDDDFVLRGQGNVYFWYYGTLCCFLAGGDAWTQWNARLRTVLPAAQAADGSFPPIDVYAREAGDTRTDRSYTTAMCVLSLEIYYRYFTPLLVGR